MLNNKLIYFQPKQSTVIFLHVQLIYIVPGNGNLNDQMKLNNLIIAYMKPNY
jgi:hypothetical protein